MVSKNIFAILALATGAMAGPIADFANMVTPEACKADCQQWSTVVGDCISNANADFSASVNTGNPLGAQFSGDLTLFSTCACAAEAVQASESCLSCASTHLHIEPVLSMQDYSLVCQDPLTNGMALYNKYKDKLMACGAAAGVVVGGTEPSTSSTEPATSSTVAPVHSSSSSATPCPTVIRSSRPWGHHKRK